jgi:hypothetical protein
MSQAVRAERRIHERGPVHAVHIHEDGSPRKSTFVFPGGTGGVNWGGTAIDPHKGKNSADRQASSKPLAMAGCQTARALGWALSRAFMPAVIAPCTCRRRATMCGTVLTVAIIDGVRIEFYFDEHPPPHFHARYAEFIA